MILGSCHLILFVSSTKYFQTVRRQCYLSVSRVASVKSTKNQLVLYGQRKSRSNKNTKRIKRRISGLKDNLKVKLIPTIGEIVLQPPTRLPPTPLFRRTISAAFSGTSCTFHARRRKTLPQRNVLGWYKKLSSVDLLFFLVYILIMTMIMSMMLMMMVMLTCKIWWLRLEWRCRGSPWQNTSLANYWCPALMMRIGGIPTRYPTQFAQVTSPSDTKDSPDWFSTSSPHPSSSTLDTRRSPTTSKTTAELLQ